MVSVDVRTDPEKIPDDITPVNLFRIVFNEYFDARLPMLENAYYSPSYGLAIYDLEDVAANVNKLDNCDVK